MKKKLLTIFIIGIAIYAVFAIVVLTLFNIISKDPIDKISITYLRNDTNIQSEYGEIISIGRNVLYKTIKEESTIKKTYTVETQSGRIIVYVTVTKYNNEWRASSFEVVEVIPNEG